MGAPDVDFNRVLRCARSVAPGWLEGCRVRLCNFSPTFQKHQGRLCSGVQIQTDFSGYRHEVFRPYRLGALLLKALRMEYPDYKIWHTLEYEYETDRLAIDLLSGGTFLREWVDDPDSTPGELDARLTPDERQWKETIQGYLLY